MVTKNKSVLIAVLLSVVLCFQAAAQIPDSIRIHIDSCLTVLAGNSLYSSRVNWPHVRQQVLDKAATAVTRAQTFEALKIAFDALGDKHAAYYHYDSEYRLPHESLDMLYSDAIRKAWSKGPKVDVRMIGAVAYLSVPYMGAKNQQQIDWYANWLHDSISVLAQENPESWIIDLRLNGGGNIRPMLAGLAPFFDDGVMSYYIDKDGNATDETRIRSGELQIDGVCAAVVKNRIRSFAGSKVAVLTGPGTASSGEITAAMFSQRPNTMLFGESTAGLVNATAGFVFNNNNTYFLITTANLANKVKVPFPEVIQPHMLIKSNDAFDDICNDTVVLAALQWLRKS